ncbi:hypothetical protein [Nocardiopsis valliformis]|uniref:hypothetical protein n=1 Tax=Nocardiopsis valliformis TaxID=239974 RepID=UPI000349CA4B|nr:hypothetical protein [Nocardiopsis valliformis]
MTNKRYTAPVTLLAALTAGMLLTGCGLVRDASPLDPETARGGEAVEEPAESPTETPEQPVSEDPGAPVSDGDPDWIPPSFATGWTIEYDPELNTHHASLDGTGCDVLFHQTTGVEQAREDGYEPVGALNYLMDDITERTGNAPVEQPATPYRIMADSGETFEFETKHATFDNSEENRTFRAGVLWLDDAELVVSSSCPTDEWDDQQFEITMLIGVASISNA